MVFYSSTLEVALCKKKNLFKDTSLYHEATFSLKNWRLHVNIYTVRFHANGIEIKVFDFKVIDSAVIKYFNYVYNYQIYNLAEIKLSKIFGRLDKFWNLVRMVPYKVNLTNDTECIL